jgi:hypothetical protein
VDFQLTNADGAHKKLADRYSADDFSADYWQAETAQKSKETFPLTNRAHAVSGLQPNCLAVNLKCRSRRRVGKN